MIMRVAAKAPASVTQNMPGRPSVKKKSMKSRPAALESRIEVVSPTSVAAPCRLEETAMQITAGTGEIRRRLQMASATGATMSTVATLSTKAEMIPAKRDSATTIQRTECTREMIMSLKRPGIFDSMKRNTVPMVPAIIIMTFQSISRMASGRV